MTPLAEQIQSYYDEEQKNKPVPIEETDLPYCYEAITPEWLTKVLCKNVPGARVESLQLGPKDTGSSNRRKISITYNDTGKAAGLQEKVFCKSSHELLNRMLLGTSGALVCETTFYNEIQPLVDIESPRALFARYDPRSFNSLIILEDVSDKVESFCTHETPMNQARVESQMEELAKMHARFLGAPELDTILNKLVTWPEYLWRTRDFGMEEGSNKGFLDAEEVIPPAVYRRYDEVWPKTLASAEKHNQLPQTFVHNDVHLKNWYCLPGDKMGLSDWQCATRGHWSRDLAYTIVTACTVEDRRRWERDLIAYYLEQMAQRGATNISFEEAWNNYRQQMMSVLTWWTITLSPAEGMPEMQPRDITLEFIRRITVAMDDLGTMDID